MLLYTAKKANMSAMNELTGGVKNALYNSLAYFLSLNAAITNFLLEEKNRLRIASTTGIITTQACKKSDTLITGPARVIGIAIKNATTKSVFVSITSLIDTITFLIDILSQA